MKDDKENKRPVIWSEMRLFTLARVYPGVFVSRQVMILTPPHVRSLTRVTHYDWERSLPQKTIERAIQSE
jgi:hypothetical protein